MSLSSSQLYILCITAVSLFPFCHPVPSQVQSVHLSAGTTDSSLKASWSSGDGDMDLYSVYLFQGTHVQDMRHVPKHITQTEFYNLVPGQLYSVTVQSVSGKKTNNSTTSGRTGVEYTYNLHVRSSGNMILHKFDEYNNVVSGRQEVLESGNYSLMCVYVCFRPLHSHQPAGR